MKFEYLLFNLIVTVGPVVSQFNRQIKHISQWRLKLLTNGIVMIPYIIWDVLVTGSHWHFNTAYTLDFRLFGLPIGEWLFFITVSVWMLVSMGNIARCETINATEIPSVCRNSFIHGTADRYMGFQHR